MKKLLTTSILLTLLSSQSLAQAANVPFPKKIEGQYYRENSQNCNVAIKLVNNNLSFQDLIEDSTPGYNDKIINQVPRDWLKDDKSQWRSGCKERRIEAEFSKFITFLANNQQLLKAAKRTVELKDQIEGRGQQLKIIESFTEQLVKSDAKFALAQMKFQECDAYKDNIDLKLYRKADSNYSFLAGLCSKYQRFDISESFFNDTLTITLYKLSMNGERPITFKLSKNDQDVWEADSYEDYYHGDQYSITKVWNRARDEVALAGMKFRPRADLPQTQANPNLIKENQVEIQKLKEKINAIKDEVEKLTKKYS